MKNILQIFYQPFPSHIPIFSFFRRCSILPYAPLSFSFPFLFFKTLCLSVIDMLKAVDFNVYNLMSLGVSIHPWSHQHYQGHRHMHHLPNFLLPLLLSLLFSRLYLTLVTPWSLPGSSLHEISQPRMLEWVAISFSRLSNWSRDWTWVFLYYYFFFFLVW